MQLFSRLTSSKNVLFHIQAKFRGYTATVSCVRVVEVYKLTRVNTAGTSCSAFARLLNNCSCWLIVITCAFTESGNVKAVEVHNLVPRRDKVTHKFFLRIILGVDLGQGA